MQTSSIFVALSRLELFIKTPYSRRHAWASRPCQICVINATAIIPVPQVERSSLCAGCHAVYSMLATHNALAWMKKDVEKRREKENTSHALKCTCVSRERGRAGETTMSLLVVSFGLKKLDFGGVEHDACAQRVGVSPVANGSEIHYLIYMLACGYEKVWLKKTHFDVCQVVSLHRGNTASLVETHLPNPAEIGE